MLIINTTISDSYRRRTTNDDDEQDGNESVKGLDDSDTTRFTTDLDGSDRSKDD